MIPKSVPGIGGQKVSLIIPGIFANIYINPGSLFYLTIESTSTNNLLVKDANGSRGWKGTDFGKVAQKSLEKLNEAAEKNKQRKLNKGLPTESSKKLELSVTAGFGGGMSRPSGGDKALEEIYPAFKTAGMRGIYFGYLDAKLVFAVTYQFWPGPPVPPLFLQLDISGGVGAHFQGTTATLASADKDDKLDPLGFTPLEFDDDSFTMPISVSLALTLGAGVAGVLSVYVRGGGELKYTLSVFYHNPYAGTQLESNRPNPRHRVDLSANVSLGIQILLFKLSVPLVGGSWKLYDNWTTPKVEAGNTESAAAGNLLASPHHQASYTSPEGFTLKDP